MGNKPKTIFLNIGLQVYNPKTEAWSMLESRMSTGRSYAGVAIIDRPSPA